MTTYPYKTISIDKAKLLSRISAAIGKVTYDLGAKPRLGTLPGSGFTKSDCSGFVRWLLYAATGGAIKLLPGSWHQQEWCKSQNFKKTDYLQHAGLQDHRLRVAFINAKNGKVGHVWLILDGYTLESHGGKGANRRKWNTDVLINNVDACYVLTEPLI